MAWTPERVETLKKLWSAGLSAGHIAGRLGGVTRNAVIGKIHRLGLAHRREAPKKLARLPRPKTFTPVAPPARRRAEAPPASSFSPKDGAELPTLEATDLAAEAGRDDCVALLDLKNNQCRFPIGDKFCGEPTCDRGAGNYCKPHAERCYDGITRKPGPKHPPSSFQFSSNKPFHPSKGA